MASGLQIMCTCRLRLAIATNLGCLSAVPKFCF